MIFYKFAVFFGADTPLNIMGELSGYGFRIVFACMKKALTEVRRQGYGHCDVSTTRLRLNYDPN